MSTYIWFCAAALFVLWMATSVLVVKQKSAAVIEFFGRFYAVKRAGLRLKFPWPFALERRGHRGERVNLRLRELKEVVSVKTLDNAFVSFPSPSNTASCPSG